MENTLGKYIYSPQIYAYKIKNKCSSKSTDGMWGLSTAFESRCPFPLHRIHLGALIVAETQSVIPPLHPSRVGRAEDAGGRATLWL